MGTGLLKGEPVAVVESTLRENYWRALTSNYAVWPWVCIMWRCALRGISGSDNGRSLVINHTCIRPGPTCQLPFRPIAFARNGCQYAGHRLELVHELARVVQGASC